jgi:hypothetical protein
LPLPELRITAGAYPQRTKDLIQKSTCRFAGLAGRQITILELSFITAVFH